LTRFGLGEHKAGTVNVPVLVEEAPIGPSVSVRTLACCPSARRSNCCVKEWCGQPSCGAESTGSYHYRGGAPFRRSLDTSHREERLRVNDLILGQWLTWRGNPKRTGACQQESRQA